MTTIKMLKSIKVLKPIIVYDKYGDEVLMNPGEYQYSPETWEIRHNGRWYDIVADELIENGYIKEV